MILNCPNCHKQIPAENVNIRQLVAVCPHCDTVFSFEPPAQKVKRRKLKQPKHLILGGDDTLQMMFRTNFRLDKNENFIGSVTGGIAMTLITFILLFAASDENIPLIFPIAFGIVALFMFYWMALIVYNKTHIEMDDRQIQISRQPIPNVLQPNHEISLSGVAGFRSEETPISKKEGYDTPRYRVLAEMSDGSQRVIVSDVIADYGFFIAQQLEEYLYNQRYPDAGDHDADFDKAHMLSNEVVLGDNKRADQTTRP